MELKPAHLTKNQTRFVDQVHKDLADDSHDFRRPRKLLLYINGDRYFPGKRIQIVRNRYSNFNDLLNDLAGKLPANIKLPHGVRQLFTPVGGRRIFDIDDLVDGETYVCAGFEGFKTIKYGRPDLLQWSVASSWKSPLMGHKKDLEYQGSYQYPGYANNAFHPSRCFGTNHPHQLRKWQGLYCATQPTTHDTNKPDNRLYKPKVITIIKNGHKPRSTIEILLNRRTVQSFEQLLADIGEALEPQVNKSKVYRLFTVRGKDVQGISDFFRGENVFIAFDGVTGNLSANEVVDVLNELFPDVNIVKSLLRDWEKNQRSLRHVGHVGLDVNSNLKKSQRSLRHVSHVGSNVNSNLDKNHKIVGHYGPDMDLRKNQRSIRHTSHIDKDVMTNKVVNVLSLNQEEHGGAVGHASEKRDSGFDSSDASTHRSETEHAGKLDILRPRKRLGRKIEANYESRNITHSKNYLLKLMEKDRLMGRKEKKESQQERIEEVEGRLVDEGMRKKMDIKNMDIQVKQFNEKITEDRIKVKEDADNEKGQRVGNEIFHGEREERSNAEKAARVRMAQAEKENVQKYDKEVLQEKMGGVEEIVRGYEKEATNRISQNSEETRKQTVGTDIEMASADNVSTSNETQTNQQDVLADDPAPTIKTQNIANSAPAMEDLNNSTNNKQHKDKRKSELAELHERKRRKTRIILKTKEERMVSSDELVLDQFELGRKLGDGNFAIVRHTRKVDTGHEYAIKIIDKTKLKGREYMVDNEISIMKVCRHQNIVRLYEEYETTKCIYLVMELVKGGDFFDAITQNIKFAEVSSALMIKDLCSALFYLHSRCVVHRDLKPENLLVQRNKDGSITLKLADFGLAMDVKGLIYTVCGTPTYVAPEILNQKGYGLEVDMWAAGVILYIMLCGFPPFRSSDRNQTELFEFIKAGKFEFLSPYWDHISNSAKDLIGQLLTVDRRRRFTAIDVLTNKWILSCGQADLVTSKNIDASVTQIRRELEEQAKLNYSSYQKSKEKTTRERYTGEE